MRLSILIFVLTLSAGISQAQQPAEQRFKNIQIFKNLPATQLDPTMAFISGSLGVRCSYCHVPNQFDKDDKPTKLDGIKQNVTLDDAKFNPIVSQP
jgi:hypothetical protein